METQNSRCALHRIRWHSNLNLDVAVDYYFIFGPELNQVIAQYREFTGAAPMLPRWAYGFWQCRERYSSQQQILDTAADFRARKIPGGCAGSGLAVLGEIRLERHEVR